MKSILCVEDSAGQRLIIQAALKDYDLKFAVNLRDGRAEIVGGTFALLILDIGLPDGNGLEMLAEIQAEGLLNPDVPVIMLTGERSLSIKETAFNSGVEDFIEKPFAPSELKMRVDARIHRAAQIFRQRNNRQIGDLVLSLPNQKLMYLTGDSAIDLTVLEFRLFSLMAETPERIFSREILIRQVWGGKINITARTVDTHVANLRRKIHKSKIQIETVFGKGYRLKVA